MYCIIYTVYIGVIVLSILLSYCSMNITHYCCCCCCIYTGDMMKAVKDNRVYSLSPIFIQQVDRYSSYNSIYI